MFHVIRHYVSSKFPALRVDLRPNLLLRALERGMSMGQVELVGTPVPITDALHNAIGNRLFP